MKFRPVTWLMIGFVRLWRLLISPLYGNVCKYHPSCSAYGLKALQTHGALKGGWLTVHRIVRCNPWSLGGYDPVPGTPEAEAWAAEQAADTKTTTAPPRRERIGATTHSSRGDL